MRECARPRPEAESVGERIEVMKKKRLRTKRHECIRFLLSPGSDPASTSEMRRSSERVEHLGSQEMKRTREKGVLQGGAGRLRLLGRLEASAPEKGTRRPADEKRAPRKKKNVQSTRFVAPWGFLAMSERGVRWKSSALSSRREERTTSCAASG